MITSLEESLGKSNRIFQQTSDTTTFPTISSPLAINESTTMAAEESIQPLADPLRIVNKFLEKLRSRQSFCSDGNTCVGSLDDEQDQHALVWDRYLVSNVHIMHPLLLSNNDSNQESKHETKNKIPSLDESLRLLQKQDCRTDFGPLEVGFANENQVLRRGFSNLSGFRGTIVQVFTIQDNFITSIYVAKTMAPWKQRWWWFRRKSGVTKKLLWQTWWEEWEEELVQNHDLAEEEYDFQRRLIETNFFLF